jgi:hypothetical protein
MVGKHELAELAPRDVVAKQIMKEMAAAGVDHVFVDGRMLGEETWRVRFPTIWHTCRQAGINPATDLIPVAPACHYFCGGVETDIYGATNLVGLYACGEVASSGVHGANRLASNSLLEGLVFARRIAVRLQDTPPARRPPAQDHRQPGLIDRSVVPALQQAMSRYAGGLRDAAGLDRCAGELAKLARQTGAEPGLESWEATNLMTVAAAVVASARLREESRGAHWRDDFEGRREAWRGHLLVEHDDQQGLRHLFVPALPVSRDGHRTVNDSHHTGRDRRPEGDSRGPRPGCPFVDHLRGAGRISAAACCHAGTGAGLGRYLLCHDPSRPTLRRRLRRTPASTVAGLPVAAYTVASVCSPAGDFELSARNGRRSRRTRRRTDLGYGKCGQCSRLNGLP